MDEVLVALGFLDSFNTLEVFLCSMAKISCLHLGENIFFHLEWTREKLCRVNLNKNDFLALDVIWIYL